MPSSAITFGPTGPPEWVVVSGRHKAESELKKFENFQDSSDQHEGWRYIIDRTDLKAGTDPAEATPPSLSRTGSERIKSYEGNQDALPLLPGPSGVNLLVKIATGAYDDESLRTARFTQSTERKAAVVSAVH